MADELKDAIDLYSESIEANRDQRIQTAEDLRFSDPSDPQQWDDTVKRQRETDPGGARPCLVMDHTGQYIANVAGQVSRNPPSIHTVPVDSGADVKVSEQIDGIIRHIEYASRAQTHYGIALTSAARVGVGYLIVRPEYVDRAMGYQEPRITSEPDPLRVVLDPWSVAIDGNDAGFGYLLRSMSERDFERRWPKAEKKSFGTQDYQNRDQLASKSIIVAEQWYKEERTRNVIVWAQPDGQEISGAEDEYWAACKAAGMNLPYSRTYRDKYQCVRWRMMSGAEVLEEPKDEDGKPANYPADEIGIVPVYGYWGINDGRMRYCGIARRARNPQRAYNYHMSEQLAYMGVAPKSPWIAAVRAIRGLESIWDRASVESRSFLPYNDVDDEGKPISAPNRTPIAINLHNHITGAEQALRDLEASIGMYQANLGAPSNETSGVAIDSRKEQGEASTSHFPQNLAASIGQIGRLIVQMAPKLIDTKRQQQIMGIDMAPGRITVDPEQPQAHTKTDDGMVVINPNIGRYDVRVVVGSSFATQRAQAQTALAEVMRNNPDLTSAIAPLWAQNLDVPHADKLAQVLTTMAPPAVQAILNPDGQNQPKPEAMAKQVQDLQQALNEAVQLAREAQAEADEAEDKLREKNGELAVKRREVEIKEYEAETKRLQVSTIAMTPEEIRLMVAQTINDMLSHPGILPAEQAPEQQDQLLPPSLEDQTQQPEEIEPM